MKKPSTQSPGKVVIIPRPPQKEGENGQGSPAEAPAAMETTPEAPCCQAGPQQQEPQTPPQKAE